MSIVLVNLANLEVENMPNNIVNNFRWVYDNCLAGSAYPRSAEQIQWLFYLQGVRTIVSFEPINDLPDVIDTIATLGVSHRNILFPDGEEPTKMQANEFVAIADECLAGNLPLLCHCKAGRGRTGLMLVNLSGNPVRVDFLEN